MNNPLWLIITIDFENMNSWLKEERYDQNLFTIEFIQPLLELLEKYDIKAVFFASVFEHCRFGKKVIREVLEYLDAKGHDVELHTHPYWCYGREHMWEYSFEEQSEIIKDGCELFKEWLDRYPVAHRAGAYGLNQDTLQVLRQNHIPIDSSMFYDRQNCKVNWSRNRVVEKEGLIEIPVTGFYHKRYLDFKLFRIKYQRKFIKTDIDWCSTDELLHFVDYAKKKEIKFINLFMHSYSFLKYNDDFTRFDVDEEALQNLSHLLSVWTKDRQIRFITMQELLDLYKSDTSSFRGSDHVPVLREDKIDVYRSLINKISNRRSN
jgi:peptidoglycan/xylan/chitin deacetylase (PgdA/CDA1 family)